MRRRFDEVDTSLMMLFVLMCVNLFLLVIMLVIIA